MSDTGTGGCTGAAEQDADGERTFRSDVHHALYLAAVVATRRHREWRTRYQHLLDRGGPRKKR